jgi:aminoglycoside N3'-acetyltransferase|tara:strand:- start:83 stop:859 length:777 start_codon:yes stop_codon:yes gene_type:complete
MDISKKTIIKHLKQLKINSNDHILFYSKLSSFGVIKKNFAKCFLSILIKYITPRGTIIMPSYTFEDKNFVFDIKEIKSNYSTGILVKEFFKKRVVRSKRLIHSHIGLGKKSGILKKKIDPTISLGANSDFDILTKNNFKCIFLGCNPDEAGTFLIHLEYLNKVPYRKKIIISKKILEKNIVKIVKVNYFDRPKNLKYDFNAAFKKLNKFGAKIYRAELRFGSSFSLTLKDFLKYGNIMFKKNKYALIKNGNGYKLAII